MTERPIHFPQPTADAMIRAVLDGSKTQHRVPVVPPPTWRETTHHLDHVLRKCNPFGKPGDRLRVRECFCIESNYNMDDNYPPPFADGRPVKWFEDEGAGQYWEQPHYRATDPDPELAYPDGEDNSPCVRWRPSTNMPRWACRITRVVKRVWVEQVQDITPEDAIAEGLIVYADGPLAPLYDHTRRDGLGFDCPVKCFRDLWDSIYAAKGYGWDANPPVWGCEFESTDEETQATTKGNS